MSTKLTATSDYRSAPSADYSYFLYSPNGDGLQFFRTREIRDAIAARELDAEREHAAEGWSPEITLLCVGEVTARATKTDECRKPEREDFEDGDAGDEQYEDAMSEWPDECWDTTCDYKLLPVTKRDEP